MFNFVEDVDGTDHHKYLWCNAAYSPSPPGSWTAAFENYGWLRRNSWRRRRRSGRGSADAYLPAPTMEKSRSSASTEVAITDRREKELSGSRFHPTGTLQEHRLCGLLQRPGRRRRPRQHDTDCGQCERARCRPSCSTCSRSRASPTT
ncbi:MAG: type VI secretion system contractile sheath large subunit [Desulfobacterales bacterium]|nr:type VI secretion system contractile sheath large subunit [Desulfobacterales bacterium]